MGKYIPTVEFGCNEEQSPSKGDIAVKVIGGVGGMAVGIAAEEVIFSVLQSVVPPAATVTRCVLRAIAIRGAAIGVGALGGLAVDEAAEGVWTAYKSFRQTCKQLKEVTKNGEA